MRKLPLQEQKIRREIRDIVTIDPLISVDRLCEALFRRGFKTAQNSSLDWHYVSRLREKIHRETIMASDRQELIARITEFKEKNRMVYERLIRIAHYTDDLKKEGVAPPSARDQISALREIVKLDLAVFNAEMDAGIFERHIGKLEIEKRYIPLPEDLKMQMMKAFKNWGIVPTDIEPKNNENNIQNTTTAIVVAK